MSRTQQFEGRLLEEALQSAVDNLGSDVQVLDARRVRSGGILGFFAREGFVVEAGLPEDPPVRTPVVGSGHGGGDDFEATFARMIERVELGQPPAPAIEQVPPVPAPPPVPVEATPVVAAVPPPAAPIPVAAIAVQAPSHPVDRRDGTLLGRPGWSHEALAGLGVPAPILERLDVDGYLSDLEWTIALERAIEAEVPPPAAWSGASAGVQGIGAESAVQLLAAGLAGFAPGTLVVDRRRIVACAAELALAVRSCLPR